MNWEAADRDGWLFARELGSQKAFLAFAGLTVGLGASGDVVLYSLSFAPYKLVQNDAAVTQAHRLYLMYRDMAAMSLLSVSLIPAGLWYAGAPPAGRWIAGGFFALQYVVRDWRTSQRQSVCVQRFGDPLDHKGEGSRRNGNETLIDSRQDAHVDGNDRRR